MSSLKHFLSSSIGKKYIMGLSGIALVLFAIQHLAGNLSLYFPSGEAFNRYTLMMHSLGDLLIVAELGLASVFLIHIVYAVMVTRGNRAARPIKYAKAESKGGPSKSNLSSRNMIVTGLVLFVFLVIHLKQFRFGPKMPEGYVTMLDGNEAWDIHRLVVETFQDPLWASFYVLSMVFLGFHLRHGFWSAFQSLGLAFPKYSKGIYCIGILTAVLLAIGFLLIPIWIFFDLSGVAS